MSQRNRGASDTEPRRAARWRLICGRKPYQQPFLNTQTVSSGCGCNTTVCLPRKHYGNYVLWLHLSSYKDKVKKKKITERGEWAQALYPDERLKDETDLSGISRALGTQCMAASLSGLFPFSSGLCLQAKDSSPNIYRFIKDSNTQMPQTPPFISRIHTLNSVLSVHLQTERSRLASQYHCRRWKQTETTDHCRLHQ